MADNLELQWSAKIAVLEHKVEQQEKALATIDGKLDQILDLRSKGQGAFWVASALFGTGIVAILIPLINFFKNGGV